MNKQTLPRSFATALTGLARFLAGERHAHIQAAFAALALGLGFWCGLSSAEWALVAVCIGAVFAAEAMNTALESLADTLHPDLHPGIAKAKDYAAAAVLCVALASLVAGALLFGPKLGLF
jgi:diacylglycerol kinase